MVVEENPQIGLIWALRQSNMLHVYHLVSHLVWLHHLVINCTSSCGQVISEQAVVGFCGLVHLVMSQVSKQVKYYILYTRHK